MLGLKVLITVVVIINNVNNRTNLKVEKRLLIHFIKSYVIIFIEFLNFNIGSIVELVFNYCNYNESLPIKSVFSENPEFFSLKYNHFVTGKLLILLE